MWRKSSYSMSNGQCLEAASDERAVLVRDSQLTDTQGRNVSPVLRFTPSAWAAFTTEVRK